MAGLSKQQIAALLNSQRSEWEVMEALLVEMFGKQPGRFSAETFAAKVGLSTYRASKLIQAYKWAQRNPKLSTLYVLRREGRTRAAVWFVDLRAATTRAIHQTLFEDVVVKFDGAKADLAACARLAPSLAPMASAISQTVDAHLALMAASVNHQP